MGQPQTRKCAMSGFWNVTREYEDQISASRVLEHKPRSEHIPFHQEGSQDLGVALGSHENALNFKHVSRTTNVMKVGLKSTPLIKTGNEILRIPNSEIYGLSILLIQHIPFV